jgi:hypothetical protein
VSRNLCPSPVLPDEAGEGGLANFVSQESVNREFCKNSLGVHFLLRLLTD